MKIKSLALLGALIVGIAATACAAIDNPAPDVKFPTFVYDSALSLKAYRLAVQTPAMLFKLPCYCDCGRASGHKSLHDCFFKADGSFNDHASGCEVCGLEMVDAAQWAREGKTIQQIRAQIDGKYAPYGNPTDTAMP